MKIHRIRGKDMHEALARAEKMFGGQAVVHSSESAPGGQVTIAISAEGPSALERLKRFGFGVVAARGARSSESSGNAGSATLPAFTPAVRDVRRRMGERGCSAEWIAKVCTFVSEHASSGMHAIDLAARAIAAEFKIAPGPRPSGQLLALALVGPTGAGKTTTLAKLAERFARSGRRVTLSSLDHYRAAAHEQLRVFAEHLELPFVALHPERSLEAQLQGVGAQATRSTEIVLIDTTGRPHNASAELARDQRALRSVAEQAELYCYLVQPATASRSSLHRASDSYQEMAKNGLILTKLDECPDPGAALDWVRERQAPLAFLCDGQEITRHLHRPTRDSLADLILRGRIA